MKSQKVIDIAMCSAMQRVHAKRSMGGLKGVMLSNVFSVIETRNDYVKPFTCRWQVKRWRFFCQALSLIKESLLNDTAYTVL